MSELERLRAASAALASLTDDEVLGGIEAALELWAEPDGYADRAARELAEARGLSRAMVRYGLSRMVAAHDRSSLARWLAAARSEAAAFATPAAGRSRRSPASTPLPPPAAGPELVAQILAGNVVGLALPAVIEALLARSAVLVKPASGEAVTAPLFKESLDRAAPILGAAIRVQSWKGGEEALESRIFGSVDFVVASGGERAMSSLRRRVAGPVLLYGPKYSIGVLGLGWRNAPDTWWEEAAREIALWDQEGCLSPRVLFVGGDCRRFAARLADALALWERRWPVRPRTPAEASEIHGFRSRYQMADGKTVGILAPKGTAWTVVWDQAPSLHAGPPARVVRITRRLSMKSMTTLLRSPKGREIQGVGLAFLGAHERGWRETAAKGGVPYTALLQRLQDPPAGWRADGRSGLAELLRNGRILRPGSGRYPGE
jgi:hypothetical protein